MAMTSVSGQCVTCSLFNGKKRCIDLCQTLYSQHSHTIISQTFFLLFTYQMLWILNLIFIYSLHRRGQEIETCYINLLTQ